MAAPTAAPTETVATPPDHRVGPAQWIRRNLFPNWWNSLLTLVFGPLLLWLAFVGVRFVLGTARWEIVIVNLTNLMVGPNFPRDQLWRLWVAAGLLAAVVGLGLGITATAAKVAAIAGGRETSTPWHEPLRRAGPPLALVAVFAVFVRTATPLVALAGVVLLAVGTYQLGLRLPAGARRFANLVVVAGVVVALLAISSGDGGVPRAAWGGFLITAYFTVGALLFAFPLGLAIALGRRSSLPVVRGGCLVYIEFFRGSPLVALLYVGWLVLPFFLPPAFPTPDLITRALIIFVLFTSAYVAEIVRGGLQSIPRGQIEAAQALGLSPWKQTRLVVLPQALRNVIPALVGQAISLFKDTTLAAIIAIPELLRVAFVVTQQDQFRGQGYIAETLVFVSFIYWVGSYWMSRESQRLEARLGVGTR
jgi:general L-amino acid transport system permease protein